jgi:GNAT superfamily N-acetyltransferase
MARVLRELLPPDTGLAFGAMRELRPWLPDEAAFVARVDEVQRPEGFRLVGAFEDGRDTAVAVAGFRIGHNLAWGRKHLYVDDLSTLPEARGRGHGRALLDWLADEARREDCEQLHLDSGLFPERVDAHRLYFNAGYFVGSLHFMQRLDGR